MTPEQIEQRIKRLENQTIALAEEIRALYRIISTEPGIRSETQELILKRLQSIETLAPRYAQKNAYLSTSKRLNDRGT